MDIIELEIEMHGLIDMNSRACYCLKITASDNSDGVTDREEDVVIERECKSSVKYPMARLSVPVTINSVAGQNQRKRLRMQVAKVQTVQYRWFIGFGE